MICFKDKFQATVLFSAIARVWDKQQEVYVRQVVKRG